MLSQTFSADNFTRIYECENRKGVDIASRFFPSLDSHTKAIHAKKAQLKECRNDRASISVGKDALSEASLKLEIANLKKEKLAAVVNEMEVLAKSILSSSFKITLSQKIGPRNKYVYSIDNSPATFFVIKQLQKNLAEIFHVKPSSRHTVVCQLRDTLAAGVSGFPFEIVRTDIASFYESIDRKVLLSELESHPLLSLSSKRYIQQALCSYGLLSKTATGIPRGVGISAYLAEVYMSPVDLRIRNIPGLVLYCRYVDDILAIFARPPTGKEIGSYKDHVLRILNERKLSNNPKKTDEYYIESSNPGIVLKPPRFEYLGYRFTIGDRAVHIRPGAAKIRKYRKRLRAAFNEYHRCSQFDSRGAYRKLVARIKLLTGNTKLSYSKAAAYTGVYYSNPFVNVPGAFRSLDQMLARCIAKIPRGKLRKRLKKYGFEKGFTSRRFHRFRPNELSSIVDAWKYA